MAWGAGAFGSGPWGGASPSGTTVIDTEMIDGAIYRLLENGNADADSVNLLTDMFSIAEILNALNQRQQKFMLDTGMIVARTAITASQGVGQYDLPTDSIMPRRLTWNTFSIGGGYGTGSNEFYGQGGYGGYVVATSVLTKVDTWEMDNGQPDWASDDSVPIAWWDNTLGQQKVGITRPSQQGVIGLLYIQLATVLDGTGIPMTVPDDWTPYILWGALADLLGHDGAAYDPVRAKYCDTRFQEGVELAQLVLKGV